MADMQYIAKRNIDENGAVSHMITSEDVELLFKFLPDHYLSKIQIGFVAEKTMVLQFKDGKGQEFSYVPNEENIPKMILIDDKGYVL